MARTSTQLVNFFAEYGGAYLGSGGPTSRLEDQLTELGLKRGYSTHVFATPTGIFITCSDESGDSHSTIFRIKESSIDLGRLCQLEAVFRSVREGTVSESAACKQLKSGKKLRSSYPLWSLFIAAFLAGAALSYPAYGQVTSAALSGVIATIIWWVTGPGLKHRIPSGIFRDFLGCILTLGLAGGAQRALGGTVEAYAVGGLVVLVPGLALTNAISELADQNLVSGTAKLMQAALTVLALGLAYVLFQDLMAVLHWRVAVPELHRPLSWLAAGLGVFLSVTAFGVLFQVPPRALPWASLTGVLAWVILKKLGASELLTSASFLASFCVGTLALILGRVFQYPSQVFSVPGIIAMLPGMLALNSFRTLALALTATGQGAVSTSGVNLATRVILIAGSIVFGLFVARLPFSLFKKTSTA